MRSQIAQLEGRFRAQTLLDRTTPLLDVLRRRIGFKSSETDSGNTQHGWTKIEVRGDDSGCRSEIVTLLCFRKDVRNVVTLIAPRVHVDRREEDAKRRVQNESVLMKVMRETKTRSESKLVRVIQTLGKSLLPADKYKRHAILKR